MRSVAAILLCAALGGCSTETEAPCTGICYRVSGGKNTAYLLGSIHVGNDRMKRFGASVTAAMDASDVFVFECDAQSDQARQTIAEMMKAKELLKEQVSADTYALLCQAAEKVGTPVARFDGLRPWAVTSQLSTQTAAIQLGVGNAGTALALGVEEQVRAKTKGKETVWLETAEEQLSVLDGFSQALQEELLKSACQLIVDPKATDLGEWPDWWLKGDAEAFARAYAKENELADPALTKEYHDGLVTERNKKMAQRLSQLLEGEEPHTYFATIGLLHLVLPEDSVLWELERMGYTVEKLE